VSLAGFLARHRRIGLDTSVFIYAVEARPKYLSLVERVLSWVESPRGSAVTSTVTMLESLVQPYRRDDLARVDGFYALLSTFPHLEWVPPTLDIADLAAQLRARHNLRTPDAIQAATALARAATGFVCNDPAFSRVTGLEVALLDRLVAGG
jgi:predicted nucleic acid-binding protein